jgi:hypothetical protein
VRMLCTLLLTALALTCGLRADAARRVDGIAGRAAADILTGRLEMVWDEPGHPQFAIEFQSESTQRNSPPTSRAMRLAPGAYRSSPTQQPPSRAVTFPFLITRAARSSSQTRVL